LEDRPYVDALNLKNDAIALLNKAAGGVGPGPGGGGISGGER
jgi:hypothetical protein